MNNYVLVILDYCWADEFDVNAFWVTTEEEYRRFVDLISKSDLSDNDEFYFGTNEWISFSSPEDLLDSLTSTSISTEFAQNLIKYLGETYGLFDITQFLEHLEYSQEEENNNDTEETN